MSGGEVAEARQLFVDPGAEASSSDEASGTQWVHRGHRRRKACYIAAAVVATLFAASAVFWSHRASTAAGPKEAGGNAVALSVVVAASCVDFADFKDKDKQTCHDYVKFSLCKDGTTGPKWDPTWGTLEDMANSDGVNPKQACCACGGGGTGAWKAISTTKACEDNDQGIARTSGKDGFADLKSCEAACTKPCVAVDYNERSQWCNFYSQACTTPKRSGAGWSSWVWTSSPATGSLGSPWSAISLDKACEDNSEGIVRTGHSTQQDLKACASSCTGDCKAIDYDFGSNWCNTYDKACTTPQRAGGKWVSYKKTQ